MREATVMRYVILTVIAAGTCSVAGMLFGVVAARHFPLFGAFAELSEPGSEYREKLIPVHVIVFGSVGLVIGLMIGVASAFAMSFASEEEPPARTVRTREPAPNESEGDLDAGLRRRIRARRAAAAQRQMIAAACIVVLLMGTAAAVAVIVMKSR